MASEGTITGVPESEATRMLREKQEKDAALAAANQPKAGSVTMTATEFQAALTKAKEDARKEEKEKLYNRIKRMESLENANKQLTTQIGELAGKLSALEAKSVQPPAPQPAAPIKSIEQIPDNMLTLIAETATADLRKQVSELTTMLKTEQEGKRQVTLQQLREQLIREANGKIIEALVVGNSDEELRANAEKARHEYDSLIARITPVVTPVVSAPPAATATAPASPVPTPIGPMVTPQVTPSSAAPLVSSEEAEFTKRVGSMTPAEFATNRTAIMKRLKEIYPAGTKNPLMSA